MIEQNGAASTMRLNCANTTFPNVPGGFEGLQFNAYLSGSHETDPSQVATPAGFEPATIRLEGECSIQLSYGAVSQTC